MRKLFLLLLCLATFEFVASQNRYAIILSGIPNGDFDTVPVMRRGYKPDALNISRNNFRLLQEGLRVQGFKTENIFFDTADLTKSAVTKMFRSVAEQIQPSDFLLIYSDLPLLTVKNGEKSSNGVRLKRNEFLSFLELDHFLKDVFDKTKSESSVAGFFDGHNLTHTSSALNSSVGVVTQFPMFFATGERGSVAEVIDGQYLFTYSLSRTLQGGSSFLDTYEALFHFLKNDMLSNSPLARPIIYSSPSSLLFNGLFKAFPQHQTVLEKISDTEFRVTGGQAQFYMDGDRVKIFNARADTTANSFLAEGVIARAEKYQSIITVEKPLKESPENLWAYLFQDWSKGGADKLKINTSYYGENKKEFDSLINSIKSLDRLRSSLEYVSKGGDIQISNVIKTNGQLTVSLANPVTGYIFQDIVADGSKLSDKVGQALDNHIKFQKLEKMLNLIPELAVNVELIPKEKPVYENGYQILYDRDEYSIKVKSLSPQRIYFSIIDLMPDRTAHLLVPTANENPADFRLEPYGELTIEGVMIEPPFGIEKFKIITSTRPVDFRSFLSGISTRGRADNGLESIFQGIAGPSNTRGASFRKEEAVSFPAINIQEIAFEIRSGQFSGDNESSNVKAMKSVNEKKITEISITKSTSDRFYYNVVRRDKDGKYHVVLPNKLKTKYMLYVDNKESVHLLPGIGVDDQILVVVADRPFELNDFSDERTINEMVADIYLTNRIPGTFLNKLSIVRPEVGTTTTRNTAEIDIQFLTPQVSTDRSGRNPTKERAIDIVGLAVAEKDQPVDSIKINGQNVYYDSRRQVFKTTVHLVPGRNKVVFDAWYNKVPATRVIEFHMEGDAPAATGAKGKNYFLGIGIDQYSSQPRLFNAKNDVTNFARLLQTKYGFESSNIKLVLDSSATRSRIIRELREFLRTTSPNDNVIIYLAGHGNEDQLADGDYYFMAQESDVSDVSTAVKSTDIVDPFRKINARHCVLIIDACYAGLITNSVTNKSEMKRNEQHDGMQPGKWIITSGRATKVGDGQAGKNSPFATVLINYLNSDNGEQKIRISKLIEHLKDAVPKISNQTPYGVQIDGKGDMFFSRN